MADNQTTPEAVARDVYAALRSLKNPFSKTWDELTEREREESRLMATAALAVGNADLSVDSVLHHAMAARVRVARAINKTATDGYPDRDGVHDLIKILSMLDTIVEREFHRIPC